MYRNGENISTLYISFRSLRTKTEDIKTLEQLNYNLFMRSLLLGKYKYKCKMEIDFDKRNEYENVMSIHGNILQSILFQIEWCKHLIEEEIL